MNRKLEDLFYAPIGLVAGASQMIPILAEQGRLQVNNARFLGEMATRLGAAKLSEHTADVGSQLHDLLVQAGLVAPTPVTASSEATPDASREPAARSTPVEARATRPKSESVSEPVANIPDAQGLAIVEYDSLAASQVVPRLAALDADELDAIRRYELAHRGRKTILGRIAQLQG